MASKKKTEASAGPGREPDAGVAAEAEVVVVEPAAKPAAKPRAKAKGKKAVVVEAKAEVVSEEDGEAREEKEDADEDADAEVVDATAEIVDEGDADIADGELAEGEEPKEKEREEEPGGESSTAISRHDPLQAYLREVQRHRLLTPEESHALAVKYTESGDVDAARRLVTANLRLVVKIAYEYRRAYKNVMDLIQEGNIGLMQAVRKFDPHRGVKLSSYSAWWIRAYILRYIINNWRLVKLGTTQAQRKLFFNLKKEKARLSAMGIEPTAEEVAKRLGVEEQEVIDMDHRLSASEASLDAPVGDSDGRAVSRIDLLPSAVSGPDTRVADAELSGMVKERLEEFRQTLKGKDIVIFDKRLIAEDPLTLQELGDEFGVSRERVRQLEARLTMHLRAFLEKHLGDAVHA